MVFRSISGSGVAGEHSLACSAEDHLISTLALGCVEQLVAPIPGRFDIVRTGYECRTYG